MITKKSPEELQEESVDGRGVVGGFLCATAVSALLNDHDAVL